MARITIKRLRHSLITRLIFCAAVTVGFVTVTPVAAQQPWLEESSQEQTLEKSRAELARVKNLIRANVLELAQEILETRAPALDTPSDPSAEWLQWERQLWTLYRVRGDWQTLYQRTQNLSPALPPTIHREARLLTVKSLIALQQGDAARALIRRELLTAGVPDRHIVQLRQELIAAYLADDLLQDARIAMDYFRRDYGAGGKEWTVLSAAVLLREKNYADAINLLAPLNQPSAQLLRVYARLGNGSLTPAAAVARVEEIRQLPRAELLQREMLAVITQALKDAEQPLPLAATLERYLVSRSYNPNVNAILPQFSVDDLFAVYFEIARAEGNRAGLLIGDTQSWLDHARAEQDEESPLPAITRRAIFAHSTVTATEPALRQHAVDAYINELIDAKLIVLIEKVFGADTPLGALSLGGEVGVRLSATALNTGNFQLAAEANATMAALPEGLEYNDWLLQAARVDILAGRHQRGADKLNEWINSFEELTAAQTDAILQPIFDLQTVTQHTLALTLLQKVNARAPAGKHKREIAFWLAESYHGNEQYDIAADLFLHSALLQADGFDRWGDAARFRAAESLMDGKHLNDARRLFEDLLARAQSDASRRALQQKLQRLWLLHSANE